MSDTQNPMEPFLTGLFVGAVAGIALRSWLLYRQNNLPRLRRKLREAVEREDYERAAILRDRINEVLNRK